MMEKLLQDAQKELAFFGYLCKAGGRGKARRKKEPDGTVFWKNVSQMDKNTGRKFLEGE